MIMLQSTSNIMYAKMEVNHQQEIMDLTMRMVIILFGWILMTHWQMAH